jgi:hypothetical protein
VRVAPKRYAELLIFSRRHFQQKNVTKEFGLRVEKTVKSQGVALKNIDMFSVFFEKSNIPVNRR